MELDPTTLFVLWLGGGFVVLLAWAGIVGHAVMGRHPAAVKPAIGILGAIGLFHPVAAITTVDLVRLSRSLERPVSEEPGIASRGRRPSIGLPSWALPASYAVVVISVLVAGALWFQAQGAA